MKNVLKETPKNKKEKIHLISCLDIYSLKTKTQKHNKQVVVAQAMMPHVTLLFFFRKFPNKKSN